MTTSHHLTFNFTCKLPFHFHFLRLIAHWSVILASSYSDRVVALQGGRLNDLPTHYKNFHFWKVSFLFLLWNMEMSASCWCCCVDRPCHTEFEEKFLAASFLAKPNQQANILLAFLMKSGGNKLVPPPLTLFYSILCSMCLLLS